MQGVEEGREEGREEARRILLTLGTVMPVSASPRPNSFAKYRRALLVPNQQFSRAWRARPVLDVRKLVLELLAGLLTTTETLMSSLFHLFNRLSVF